MSTKEEFEGALKFIEGELSTPSHAPTSMPGSGFTLADMLTV
jgi:hypothetical protein